MMITCITESNAAVQETLRTLRFTMSAARIRNKPVRFLDPQEKLILELKEEIKRLRIENQHLRQASISSTASSQSNEDGYTQVKEDIKEPSNISSEQKIEEPSPPSVLTPQQIKDQLVLDVKTTHSDDDKSSTSIERIQVIIMVFLS